MQLLPYLDSTGTLTARRGDTFSLSLTYTEAGTAKNFTGYSMIFQAKASESSETVRFEASTTDGGITAGSTGTITIEIAAETMAGVSATPGTWALQYTAPDGFVKTFLSGSLVMKEAAIRRPTVVTP